MISARYVASDGELRNTRRILMAGVGLLVLIGLFLADSLSGLAAYVLITAAATLPAVTWVRTGAPGIPILTAVGALHYLYFALPILRGDRGNLTAHTATETLFAAGTVVLFLVAATLAWRLVVGRSIARKRSTATDVTPSDRLIRLMFLGLAIGLFFQLAVMSGWLRWAGPYFGLVRTVAMSVTSIACYILGHVRARHMLRGPLWLAALVALGLLTVLNWSSLYLIGGMLYLAAVALGYTITARRIPWTAVAAAVGVLLVLHAGKFEMRDRYWATGQAPELSAWQMPSFATEWAAAGVTAIVTGDDVHQDVFDRASLLYLLLKVERLTPAIIPYLGGDTYALLPDYLVPRFLNPNKTFSQAGLALLNIRYGIQSAQGVATTTIGWGLISEAFANFGLAGVLGVGLLFGLLCALFTRWSAGAGPLSLPSLLSISALIVMVNVEVDLAYLLTNLGQALAATLLFFLPVKILSPNPHDGPSERGVRVRSLRHQGVPS